jgi:hypothetical protein
MQRRSRLNKGELLKRHLQEKAVSILGHDRFEMTLQRGFRWLITLFFRPKEKLSRRKRARLRNELFATLDDIKESLSLAAGGAGGPSCRTPSIDGSPIWSTPPVAFGARTGCGDGGR